MQRRKLSRDCKVGAVRLVRARGVSIAQAGRDLDVHENVLRKWAREFRSDSKRAFSGHSQQRPGSWRSAGCDVNHETQGGARYPKKGSRLLCEGADMKFGFIVKHQDVWPVARLWEALSASQFGLHAQLGRGPRAPA